MGLVMLPVLADSVATVLKGCLNGMTLPVGVVAEGAEVMTGPAIVDGGGWVVGGGYLWVCEGAGAWRELWIECCQGRRTGPAWRRNNHNEMRRRGTRGAGASTSSAIRCMGIRAVPYVLPRVFETWCARVQRRRTPRVSKRSRAASLRTSKKKKGQASRRSEEERLVDMQAEADSSAGTTCCEGQDKKGVC